MLGGSIKAGSAQFIPEKDLVVDLDGRMDKYDELTGSDFEIPDKTVLREGRKI